MKVVISLLVAFVVTVVGITWYLGPDDLQNCALQPGTKQGCAKADAIVAVSGGDTAARTREAIKLYKAGWAPKLVFSGAAQDKSGPSNAEVMKREAQAAGVQNSDIIIESHSETTKQNAEKTQSIFTKNNISSIIVVTSAYHQRRAGLEFALLSGDRMNVRNHPVNTDNQWSAWWWLTPGGWFLAIGELVKIIGTYIGVGR